MAVNGGPIWFVLEWDPLDYSAALPSQEGEGGAGGGGWHVDGALRLPREGVGVGAGDPGAEGERAGCGGSRGLLRGWSGWLGAGLGS
jgi:hypothetical protein